jgi:hypothetical protein
VRWERGCQTNRSSRDCGSANRQAATDRQKRTSRGAQPSGLRTALGSADRRTNERLSAQIKTSGRTRVAPSHVHVKVELLSELRRADAGFRVGAEARVSRLHVLRGAPLVPMRAACGNADCGAHEGAGAPVETSRATSPKESRAGGQVRSMQSARALHLPRLERTRM